LVVNKIPVRGTAARGGKQGVTGGVQGPPKFVARRGGARGGVWGNGVWGNGVLSGTVGGLFKDPPFRGGKFSVNGQKPQEPRQIRGVPGGRALVRGALRRPGKPLFRRGEDPLRLPQPLMPGEPGQFMQGYQYRAV
jgi:hypothetical protein